LPHCMPHIKVLNFVYLCLRNFLANDKHLDNADQDMLDEVNNTLDRIGFYIDKVVHMKNSTSRLSASDFEKLIPTIDRYTPIGLGTMPITAFNSYYALLINCFAFAQSGGRFEDGYIIVSYDQLLKYHQLFTEDYFKKHFK